MEIKKVKKEIMALLDELDQLVGKIPESGIGSGDAGELEHKTAELYKKIHLLEFLGASTSAVSENQQEEGEENKRQMRIDLFGEAIPEEVTSTPASGKSGKKTIPDLRQSVSVNQKFQFINELFEGSAQEYGMAVNQLDSFNNMRDAFSYLDSLKDIYRWDENAPALQKLKELIQRRYPK